MRIVSTGELNLDLRQFDLLAEHSSQNIDQPGPQVNLLATLTFVICVASFDRYSISALLPFFIFPVTGMLRNQIPLQIIAPKVLLVLPFALLIGILNPLFDTTPVMQLGTIPISGGWLSCVSILLRAALTTTAALVLLATTGFTRICSTLGQLGLPAPLVAQLLFMYRYLYLLSDDVAMAMKARRLRSQGKLGMGIGPYCAMVTHLLLRSWERAERIHMAMLARGFNGNLPIRQQNGFCLRDAIWLLGWVTLFIVFRLVNLPLLLGSTLAG